MQNMLVFVSILQQRTVDCDVAKYFQSTSVPVKNFYDVMCWHLKCQTDT